MTNDQTKDLAAMLADGYGSYCNDEKSMYPIDWYICRSGDGRLYVDGGFDVTPVNSVAYIGEMKEPPGASGGFLKKHFLDDFLRDIENAEWEEVQDDG